MRHRSPRPVLDRLPSPATLRRGAIAAGAVAALGTATAVALTAGAQTGTAASDAPVTRAEGPSSLVAPTALTSARSDRPNRGVDRPPLPPTPTPTTPTPQPSQAAPTQAPSAAPTRVPAARTPSPTPPPPVSQPRSAAPAPSTPPSASPSSSPSTAPSDSTPPQTTARTAGLVGAVWTLVLGADEPATFTCSLDGGAWRPCAATDTITLLTPGSHTVAVRATDPAGNTDPSPATVSVQLSPLALG